MSEQRPGGTVHADKNSDNDDDDDYAGAVTVIETPHPHRFHPYLGRMKPSRLPSIPVSRPTSEGRPAAATTATATSDGGGLAEQAASVARGNADNDDDMTATTATTTLVDASVPCLRLIRTDESVERLIPWDYKQQPQPGRTVWDRWILPMRARTTIAPKEVASIDTGYIVQSYPYDTHSLQMQLTEFATRRGLVLLNPNLDSLCGWGKFASIIAMMYNANAYHPVDVMPGDWYLELKLIPKANFMVCHDGKLAELDDELHFKQQHRCLLDDRGKCHAVSETEHSLMEKRARELVRTNGTAAADREPTATRPSDSTTDSDR